LTEKKSILLISKCAKNTHVQHGKISKIVQGDLWGSDRKIGVKEKGQGEEGEEKRG